MPQFNKLAAAAALCLLATSANAQTVSPIGGSGGGSGNVVGPGSSVNGDIAEFCDTTGKLICDPGFGPTFTLAGNSVSLGGTITATTILDSIGGVSGDILYRNGSVWTALPKAADGTFLTLASGIPAWVASPGGGTMTSLTCGNGLNCASSNPITTSGTISSTTTLNSQTGTTYATLSTDGGKTVTLSNASAVAVSLVQANTTNFTSGFGTTYANIGVGTVTVTAATSTFGNGLTTLVLATGQVADIASDSTNYPFTAVSLPKMAVDTILGNFSGTANFPIAGTLPTCSGATSALTYNTSTHALGCNSITPPATTLDTHYVANNWYHAAQGTVVTGANISATITYWVPKYFSQAVTIGTIGGRITTASAGGNVQEAVYAADATTGLPTGAALCSTASQSTTSTGLWGLTCSATISGPGWYWFGIQVDNATAAMLSMSDALTIFGYQFGTSVQNSLTGSSSTGSTAYSTTGGTFGTWPSTPTVGTGFVTANVIPDIQYKIASVP